MALQGSGQISLSNIASEMGLTASNLSLGTASTHSTLNDQSPSKPNESQPHGMAEFYSYDHNYSSFKPLMGGNVNSSGKWFDFCGDEVRNFYYYDGSKDMAVVGDTLYMSDRGSYYPFGTGLTKISAADAPPEGGEYYVATTDTTGKITRLDNCEGVVQDPKEPGVGGPDEPENPFKP